MRFNETGALGSAWGSTDDDGRDLPEDVQNDVDRVADVVAAGFRGPAWQKMAKELYVPPGGEAAWARTRAQAKARKTAA
ncbi:hypothetical protein [Streptomyces sp. NPDC002790]|uniref:hypothetical protein n=1 Tax=Streptomyces sp. NPDC002790 TaxID=3154431 RepID=UPI00331F8D7E